jgi:hypothetical protein
MELIPLKNNKTANLTITALEWHNRLGQSSIQKQNHMSKIYPEIKTLQTAGFECKACIMRKMKRSDFREILIKTLPLQHRVSSDICGPFPTPSLGNNLYFMLIVENTRKYGEVYMLKNRTAESVTKHLMNFVELVENLPAPHRVNSVHTNNPLEHRNKDLEANFSSKGMRKTFTTPHTAQSHGVVERMNKTVMSCVRTFSA